MKSSAERLRRENAGAGHCRVLRATINPRVTRVSWIVCWTLGVLLSMAAVGAAASDTHRQLRPVPVHRIGLSVPALHNAVALGTLVALYTTAHNAGGAIKLARLTQRVGDLLQVTKLVTIFEVFDTEEQAVESFRKVAA